MKMRSIFLLISSQVCTPYYLQLLLVMSLDTKFEEITIVVLQCKVFLKNDARREEQQARGNSAERYGF